jgi:hypothetical protein
MSGPADEVDALAQRLEALSGEDELERSVEAPPSEESSSTAAAAGKYELK